MTVNITLPTILKFDDYHNIDDLVYNVNLISTEKIKGKEIGFDGKNYVGIFYTKTLPSKSEINELLKQNNITLI